MLAGLVARSVDLIADGHVEHVAGDDTNAGDTVGVAAQPGDEIGPVEHEIPNVPKFVDRCRVLFVDIEIASEPTEVEALVLVLDTEVESWLLADLAPADCLVLDRAPR